MDDLEAELARFEAETSHLVAAAEAPQTGRVPEAHQLPLPPPRRPPPGHAAGGAHHHALSAPPRPSYSALPQAPGQEGQEEQDAQQPTAQSFGTGQPMFPQRAPQAPPDAYPPPQQQQPPVFGAFAPPGPGPLAAAPAYPVPQPAMQAPMQYGAGPSVGGMPSGVAQPPVKTQPAVPSSNGKLQKKWGVPRIAAGEKWYDSKLAEWPENDFRIFVGDLGNEVNDDTLIKAFSNYATMQKAAIVRDKRTKKSKGYGFVSFSDPVDGAKALREMQGRYIGNRPCKLKKSHWEERTPAEMLKAAKRKAKNFTGEEAKPKKRSVLHK